MRPKTNLQKEVYNLHGELPPITAEQADYGKDKCFKPKGFATSKNIWCAECGKEFKREDSQLSISLFGVDCPHCGKHLEVNVSDCRTYKPQRQYYTVETVKEALAYALCVCLIAALAWSILELINLY